MKKRNLVLLGTTAMLSLALAGTIGAVTASAAELNKDTTSNTTTVQYTVEEKWTVTIPDSITIDFETGKSAGTDKVTIAADAILGSGNTNLTVTVTGDFELEAAGGEKLKYELRVSDSSDFSSAALTTGGTVVSTTGGSEEKSVNLEAKLADSQKAAAAGTYEDTLTFEVSQS